MGWPHPAESTPRLAGGGAVGLPARSSEKTPQPEMERTNILRLAGQIVLGEGQEEELVQLQTRAQNG